MNSPGCISTQGLVIDNAIAIATQGFICPDFGGSGSAPGKSYDYRLHQKRLAQEDEEFLAIVIAIAESGELQ